jgi:hypothetical protein
MANFAKGECAFLLGLWSFEFDFGSVVENRGWRFVSNPRHEVWHGVPLTEPAGNCRAAKLVIVHTDVRQARSPCYSLDDARHVPDRYSPYWEVISHRA